MFSYLFLYKPNNLAHQLEYAHAGQTKARTHRIMKNLCVLNLNCGPHSRLRLKNPEDMLLPLCAFICVRCVRCDCCGQRFR